MSSPFPIVADRVQLTLDPVDPLDAFLSGLRLKADDSAVRASTFGTAYYNAGRPFTATGQLVYVDATGGLPANTTYVNGLPISPEGALCVSSGVTASYSNGVPFVANGAVAAVFGTLSQQIATLMASIPGAAKVWYDPWDIATLQQDSAGTTPVTTAGDPIGRIMDKSGAANHATQATTTSRPLWQTTYAALDGVDDSWSTPSIDFTSTSAVTVVAGARKASDALAAVVYELGTSAATIDGSFCLFAPRNNVAGMDFSPVSRGTAAVQVTATLAAPVTAVATVQASISQPLNSLRLNGAPAASNGSSQGTGNFSNLPLFIGRRNNTSLPFNGNLYGLIIIGRLLTAPELSLCEQYMAGQSGISF